MPKWSDFLVKPTKFSNYPLSTTKRGSASPGILYPVWYRVMNPGEIFRMNIRSLIRTNPVLSPLMGRFKVRVVTVVSNFKNYAIGLEGYRRSFDWRSFTLPYERFYFNASLNNGTINGAVKETSLLDYLGYEVGYLPNSVQYPNYDRDAEDTLRWINKSAMSRLVYYDFYRNYLVNPQETFYPFFYADDYTDESSNRYYRTMVKMKSIAQLDALYQAVHTYYDGVRTEPISRMNRDIDIDNADPEPISGYFFESGYQNQAAYHGGLVGTMFDPDINTQWLSTNNFARLQAVKVNTQGTSSSEGGIYTNFEDIVKASSIWDFVSREIYGGGTYADHIYSQFGVSVRSDMNIPQIVHIFDSMVDFEDITSQSATEGAVVGEQFGVGRGFGQSSRFTIRNIDNNYAIAMSFMWITPMVDYASGVPDDSNILNFSDLYTPAFDNYSMQPRFFEQVCSAPVLNEDNTVSETNSSLDTVIGYQPAWSEYKTDVNRLHGLFANQLSYWAIPRKVPQIGTNIQQYTSFPTYVYQSPIGSAMLESEALQYEVPFSVVNEDNFFYQLRFDIVASRPMSKSVLPGVK